MKLRYWILLILVGYCINLMLGFLVLLIFALQMQIDVDSKYIRRRIRKRLNKKYIVKNKDL